MNSQPFAHYISDPPCLVIHLTQGKYRVMDLEANQRWFDTEDEVVEFVRGEHD